VPVKLPQKFVAVIPVDDTFGIILSTVKVLFIPSRAYSVDEASHNGSVSVIEKPKVFVATQEGGASPFERKIYPEVPGSAELPTRKVPVTDKSPATVSLNDGVVVPMPT
jgi:hypothetical protein